MPLILEMASETKAAAPSNWTFLPSHPGVGNPFALLRALQAHLFVSPSLFFHPLLPLQQIIKQTATTALLESPQLVVVKPEGPGPLLAGRADGPVPPARSTPLPPPRSRPRFLGSSAFCFPSSSLAIGLCLLTCSFSASSCHLELLSFADS